MVSTAVSTLLLVCDAAYFVEKSAVEVDAAGAVSSGNSKLATSLGNASTGPPSELTASQKLLTYKEPAEMKKASRKSQVIVGCSDEDTNFPTFREELARFPEDAECCAASTPSEKWGGLDKLNKLYFLDDTEFTPADLRYEHGSALTFMWGHDFAGKTKEKDQQVLAWKYSPTEKKIKFFYAKDKHMDRDSTNKIGTGMKAACWASSSNCPDLEYRNKRKTYVAGDEVDLPNMGTLVLKAVPDAPGRPEKMRLVKPESSTSSSPCILRYVYSCKGGGYVPMFKNPAGVDC